MYRRTFWGKNAGDVQCARNKSRETENGKGSVKSSVYKRQVVLDDAERNFIENTCLVKIHVMGWEGLNAGTPRKGKSWQANCRENMRYAHVLGWDIPLVPLCLRSFQMNYRWASSTSEERNLMQANWYLTV